MSKFTKTIAGFAGAVALVASLAGSAGAASFSTNLTVGSRGADVSALQSWLVSRGYLTMPAGVSMGYFGGLTKAAVAAYQSAKGISPAVGYFGPITRAAVNGDTGGSVSTVPGCGAGALYNSITGASCTGSTGSTGGSTGSFVMDGTDGSVTVSLSPYVTTSQTLKKGDTKDIYAVKFQATSGKVNVNRFDVYFDTRPWLIFGKLVLKDSNGNVLATKVLSGAADATEITAGSDYLVRFDNVNAVVSPDADLVLVVNASVLAASDKIVGQTVHVQVPGGAIRTINGKGYTDSLGLGTEFNAPNMASLVLSSTGSTGDLYTRVDPSTPDTRNETVSTTNTTEAKTLGVFGLKAQNRGGVINSLSVNIQSVPGYDKTTLFQNVRLMDGATTYGANSLSSGGVASFTNLTINLAQDQWKSLKVVADVLATSTSFSASSTLDLSTVVGTDDNYSSFTCEGGTTCSSVGAGYDVSSNNVTFVPNGGITISGISSSKGSVTTPTSGTWLAAYPTLNFTVTNSGNNPIFISKTASVALATTTSSGPNASSTVTSVVASGSTTGDSTAAYIVNVGASRTFSYNYTVDNTNGTTAAKKLSITQINYGTGSTDGTDNTLNVNFGLENLYVQIP
ncbi:MAG: peptidoglycan-binding domain-containing protein [Patescibacteria group bacterium]